MSPRLQVDDIQRENRGLDHTMKNLLYIGTVLCCTALVHSNRMSLQEHQYTHRRLLKWSCRGTPKKEHFFFVMDDNRKTCQICRLNGITKRRGKDEWFCPKCEVWIPKQQSECGSCRAAPKAPVE